MENIESTVNAEPVVNVEPQETEQVNQPESVPGEVATPQEEKPVQTPEQNSFYADMRRKAEAEAKAQAQKEIDQFYSQQYGEYGIHSKADYEKAVQAQQEEQQRQEYLNAGLNPDLINQLINENPTVKEANKIIAEQQERIQLSNELKSIFDEFPDAKEEDITEEIIKESIENKKSLSDVFRKHEISRLKNKLAEFEKGAKTSEINSKNATASTGSTTGNGANTSDFISKETFEANKHNQRWMDQNYDNLTKSMNRW